MTVYARHSRGFEDGVEIFAFDPMPDHLHKAWEVYGGIEWLREDDDWVVNDGKPPLPDEDPRWAWEELLDSEFGPLTDDPAEVLHEPSPHACPICGVGGCAGHTRKPSDVLVPVAGGDVA